MDQTKDTNGSDQSKVRRRGKIGGRRRKKKFKNQQESVAQLGQGVHSRRLAKGTYARRGPHSRYPKLTMYGKQASEHSRATRGPYQRSSKCTKPTNIKDRSRTVAEVQHPESIGTSNSKDCTTTTGQEHKQGNISTSIEKVVKWAGNRTSGHVSTPPGAAAAGKSTNTEEAQQAKVKVSDPLNTASAERRTAARRGAQGWSASGAKTIHGGVDVQEERTVQ